MKREEEQNWKNVNDKVDKTIYGMALNGLYGEHVLLYNKWV